MDVLTFSLFVTTSRFVKESHNTGSNEFEKGRERCLFMYFIIYLFGFHLSSQTKLMLRCVNVARMYLCCRVFIHLWWLVSAISSFRPEITPREKNEKTRIATRKDGKTK